MITSFPSASNSKPFNSIISFVCFRISALVGFTPFCSFKCFFAMFQTLSPSFTLWTSPASTLASGFLSVLSVLSVLPDSSALSDPLTLPVSSGSSVFGGGTATGVLTGALDFVFGFSVFCLPSAFLSSGFLSSVFLSSGVFVAGVGVAGFCAGDFLSPVGTSAFTSGLVSCELSEPKNLS